MYAYRLRTKNHNGYPHELSVVDRSQSNYFYQDRFEVARVGCVAMFGPSEQEDRWRANRAVLKFFFRDEHDAFLFRMRWC